MNRLGMTVLEFGTNTGESTGNEEAYRNSARTFDFFI